MFLFFHSSGEFLFFPIMLAFHLTSIIFFFRAIYLLITRKSKIAFNFGIITFSVSIVPLLIYNIFRDMISTSILSILIYPFGFLWAFFGGAIMFEGLGQNNDMAFFEGTLSPNLTFLLVVINIYFLVNIIEIAERKWKSKNHK